MIVAFLRFAFLVTPCLLVAPCIELIRILEVLLVLILLGRCVLLLLLLTLVMRKSLVLFLKNKIGYKICFYIVIISCILALIGLIGVFYITFKFIPWKG